MAKTDWAQLNAEFLQEHEATGISAKDWCDSRGLNYNSARRYLKSRGQSPAQPDKSRVAAQSAHSEVRKTAQSAQTELRNLRNSTRNEKQLRGRQAKSGQGVNTNGRDIGRRFTDGDPMRALTSAKVWAEVWASTHQERQARDWRGLEGYMWRRDRDSNPGWHCCHN